MLFSCEFCEISKKISFAEQLRSTASAQYIPDLAEKGICYGEYPEAATVVDL